MHEQIISSLEKLGATVDKENFATNMTKPEFAEKVRSSLEGAGATVPDSSTFYNKYGKVEQPTTYSYNSPEDYELLKRNVAEVGYSGLDDKQKALFQSQFPSSKFARAGGSFDEAIKYVDSQAPKTNLQLFKQGYQAARESIGHLINIPLSELDAIQSTKDGPNGTAVLRYPGKDYFERVPLAYKELEEDVKQNKGLSGFAADPMNYVGFGVKYVANPLSKLVLGTKLVDGIAEGKNISSVLASGAVEGATVGGLGYVGNVENPTASGYLGAGLVGGAIGAPLRLLASSPEIAMTNKRYKLNQIEKEMEALGVPTTVEQGYINSKNASIAKNAELMGDDFYTSRYSKHLKDFHDEGFSPEEANVLAHKAALNDRNEQAIFQRNRADLFQVAEEAAKAEREGRLGYVADKLVSQQKEPAISTSYRFLGNNIPLGDILESSTNRGQLNLFGKGVDVFGNIGANFGRNVALDRGYGIVNNIDSVKANVEKKKEMAKGLYHLLQVTQ